MISSLLPQPLEKMPKIAFSALIFFTILLGRRQTLKNLTFISLCGAINALENLFLGLWVLIKEDFLLLTLVLPFLRKMPVNRFNFILAKVKSTIQNWNHSWISIAGRASLLNSTIFAIPNYLLSIMHLHISTLESISNLARQFLWGKTGNRNGFHSIGWIVTTFDKTEGLVGEG